MACDIIKKNLQIFFNQSYKFFIILNFLMGKTKFYLQFIFIYLYLINFVYLKKVILLFHLS